MPEPDLLELFLVPLEQARVSYLVTGSIAATFYGEPRATHDIDLVIALGAHQIDALTGAFPSESFYVPPPEVLREEVEREARGHFNVIHHATGLKADCYLASGDTLHAWAFENVRRYDAGNLEVRLAPPEYVITRKLEFFQEGGSEKHLRDIRAMLSVSAGLIDRPLLDRFVEERDLGAAWSQVEPGD